MLPGCVGPQIAGEMPVATWVGSSSNQWAVFRQPLLCVPMPAVLVQAIATAHLDFCLQPPGESPAAGLCPPLLHPPELYFCIANLFTSLNLHPSGGLPLHLGSCPRTQKGLTKQALESWPLHVFLASLLVTLNRDNNASWGCHEQKKPLLPWPSTLVG